MWNQLRHEGFAVPRCRVERLMRADGLRGVRRCRQFVTTRPDPSAAGRLTWSIGRSPPLAPTSFGSSTSPTWPPGQARCSLRSSLTCSPAVSSVGAPRRPCPPSCPSTPSRWPCGQGHGPAKTSTGSCTTPTPPNTPRSATRTGSSTPALSPPSAPSATASTTPSPSRSSGSTRPSSSAATAPGGRRGSRARHPRLGPLVQRDPTPQQHRLHPTRRARSQPLPSDHRPGAAAPGRTNPPLNPGRISAEVEPVEQLAASA